MYSEKATIFIGDCTPRLLGGLSAFARHDFELLCLRAMVPAPPSRNRTEMPERKSLGELLPVLWTLAGLSVTYPANMSLFSGVIGLKGPSPRSGGHPQYDLDLWQGQAPL